MFLNEYGIVDAETDQFMADMKHQYVQNLNTEFKDILEYESAAQNPKKKSKVKKERKIRKKPAMLNIVKELEKENRSSKINLN